MTDSGRINHDPAIGSVLVFNYGDPAYRGFADSRAGLAPAAAIFVRLLAYLTFAENICVPVRHILTGDAMSAAISWATPLLEAGLILPARRADLGSFEDNARSRSASPAVIARAVHLDVHARRPYLFRYTGMAGANRSLLDGDLALDGAFRRTVSGGRRGKYAAALSEAAVHHQRNGDGSPDSFVDAVVRYASDLRHHATRWAMARYYTTPALSGTDLVNTREVPRSAADLLIRVGALSPAGRTFSGAAPIDLSLNRLSVLVPALPLGVHHERFCAALLEVRREVPDARKVFADVLRADQLAAASQSVSHEFQRELARQMRSLPGKGRAFALVSSLLGGVAGAALGLFTSADPAIGATTGLASGVVTGVAANEIQKSLEAKSERRRRPWLVAMDRLEAKASTNGSQSG